MTPGGRSAFGFEPLIDAPTDKTVLRHGLRGLQRVYGTTLRRGGCDLTRSADCAQLRADLCAEVLELEIDIGAVLLHTEQAPAACGVTESEHAPQLIVLTRRRSLRANRCRRETA